MGLHTYAIIRTLFPYFLLYCYPHGPLYFVVLLHLIVQNAGIMTNTYT